MSGVDRRPPRGGLAAGIDVKRGAIFGAAAWAFGVVLTAVLAWIEFGDAEAALGEEYAELSEFLPTTVDLVGFLFYNAHFVEVGFDHGVGGLWINLVQANVEVTGLGTSQATMGDLSWASELEPVLAALVGTVPTAAWLLVPVLTLGWGGYVVAARNGVSEPAQGAKTGASVVVGYSVLAVAGTFLFTWQLSASGESLGMTVGPRLTGAAGVMGVAYPAIFGGIGGWVAVRTGRAGASQEGSPPQRTGGRPQDRNLTPGQNRTPGQPQDRAPHQPQDRSQDQPRDDASDQPQSPDGNGPPSRPNHPQERDAQLATQPVDESGDDQESTNGGGQPSRGSGDSRPEGGSMDGDRDG